MGQKPIGSKLIQALHGASARWPLLLAAAAIVVDAARAGGAGHLLVGILLASAFGAPFLPRSVTRHPHFEWSLFLSDVVLVALALLASSNGTPIVLGLYFLNALIAVLAASSSGWGLAGLAVPGLYLAIVTGDAGAGAIASGPVLLRSLFLAASSYYFLSAIRRLSATASLSERARRESRELWALLEIADTIGSTLDLRRVMSLIVQRVSELVRAESCSILLADPKLRNCWVLASNERSDVDMLEIDLEKYPELRRALDTREPVVVEDVANDPLLSNVREILIEKGYRSMMVLPLLYGREVLGTLFLRASRGRPFSQEEMRFCKVVAGASANALKNALLYQDVAREAAQHRATGEKLRRVLDCTPDLIVATDPEGRVTEFGGGAEKITGFPTSRALGREFVEIVGGAPFSDEDAGEDGILRRDVVLRTPAGEEREVSMASAPLVGPDGGPSGRVWIGRDVTHVRRVERSLAQVERLSTLGEVVAGVAHELNNPLSAVLGYSELLRKSAEREEQIHDLERVVEAARRCKRIVQNLLGFARKYNPSKSYEDLNACVRRVFDLKAYHLRASRIETTLDLEPELPATLFDYHQIEQVLLNLVNNAEQAIVGIGRPGRIVARSYLHGKALCLEIEDDGPGIPREHQSRVFDPFFTTKEVGQGTGLGLSVSFGIVREHGGTLALRPTCPSGGACFVMTLPLIRMPAIELPPSGDSERRDEESPLRGSRILVAEDEPMVLDFVSRVLEQEGVTVVRARDGEEAWERIADAEFDLVIADLRMPRLDGQELYERVAEVRPDLLRRFVFSTGDLARAESLSFLQGLPNGLLAKPLQVETVRHVLIRALATAKSRA